MHRLFSVFKLLLITTALVDFSKCDGPALTTEDSIIQMGYPLEKYKVQTLDRYTLGLERIPYGRNGSRIVGKPVLLMHGLFLSSYVFAFWRKSLSYSLADAGYDVWLYNCRGTGLSRTYSIYTRMGSPPRMNRISWDFSFDEMGAFDFPAVVDFVLNKTGHAKLDVVGYSLGATIAIAGMSEKPAYNKKIDKLVLMAPTTRMAAYKFPVNLFHRFSFMFKYAMKGQRFFPITQDPDAAHRYLRWVCTYRVVYPYCWLFINTAQGTRVKAYKNNIINALADFPQPVSKKMLFHWVQLMSSKKFCKYDYGFAGNMRIYNTRYPPEYDLSKITAPTFIIHSKNDHLAAREDVTWLTSKIPSVVDVNYISKVKFGHLSFVMHPMIEPLVNEKIKNVLARNTFN